jgi:hypothetical protein
MSWVTKKPKIREIVTFHLSLRKGINPVTGNSWNVSSEKKHYTIMCRSAYPSSTSSKFSRRHDTACPHWGIDSTLTQLTLIKEERFCCVLKVRVQDQTGPWSSILLMEEAKEAKVSVFLQQLSCPPRENCSFKVKFWRRDNSTKREESLYCHRSKVVNPVIRRIFISLGQKFAPCPVTGSLEQELRAKRTNRYLGEQKYWSGNIIGMDLATDH